LKSSEFWRECYRDLRSYAGDERLPYELRVALRGAADRALSRSEAAEQRAIAPLLDRRAIAAARHERPVAPRQPLVTVEVRAREALFSDALDLLRGAGFQVARVGDASHALEPSRLGTSAFVICGSAELQRAAYDTGTPCLRLDARDPFTAYPVRRDCLFTLASAVDLDNGQVLGFRDLLTEHYFRNTRNYGYRPTSRADVVAAVGEMLRGIRDGWTETESQAACRRAIAEAGVALGGRARHIREWNADTGFIGDGRLAAVQAARAL
jgi:hypothetical protein